jgi:hypothetical protein
VVYKYDLHYGDVVEFKLQTFALKMVIYKADCSTTRLYTCPDHGWAVALLYMSVYSIYL